MHIIIGSQNQPKIDAVKTAFEKVFPGEVITITGLLANSGVDAHPTSAEQAIRGAEHRLMDAKRQQGEADYFVGFESGLLKTATRTLEVAWIVIESKDGRRGTGISCGFEIRGKMLKQIIAGKELSDVIADDFGVSEIGKENGFSGMITNNTLDRKESYVQGVIFALAPFLHPEYYVD